MRSAIVTSITLAVVSKHAESITVQRQDPSLANPFDNAKPADSFLKVGESAKGMSQLTQAQAEATEAKVWLDKSLAATQRADGLLKAMTRSEKWTMLHGSCMSCPTVGRIPGNDRLGIPPMTLHDGPQGVRNEPFARATSTSWPGAMAIASSWDPAAAYEWGVAMGQEFHAKGANVQLGPGVNLARVPTNGRNFEYLSGEDPYLGYQLIGPVVKGIQEQKVIACAKHWVVNSDEVHRMDGNEIVDERTLHEVYYPPFEAAVNAGIGSFMCAYNKVNGTSACENSAINNNDLKTTLGFKGFVMSDWGATHSPLSIKGGLDQEQPVGSNMKEDLEKFGFVSEEEVDASTHRILFAMFQAGIMDEPVNTWDAERFFGNVSTTEHIALARKLGAEGTVLLKNDRNVLPLPQNKKIALLGFADQNAFKISFGHGSGEVVPSYFVPPTVGIKEAAGQDAEIIYNSGIDLEAAKLAAKDADYAVVFVGASASEGGDRQGLGLDGNCAINTFGRVDTCDGPDAYQNKLISEIASVNKNTIVVLSVPGAILMPWSNEVASALVNFMPGQEAGHAIADVLFGKVNPTAKLPITMPNRENELDFTMEQYPGIRGSDGTYQLKYTEALLVGYRHYDAMNKSFTTGFAFGHGLSYTNFTYSKPTDAAYANIVAGPFISFTVTNTGNVAGAEVAQLYLEFPESVGEPRQLKGFKKTAVLQPGESELVTLKLEPRDISMWDVKSHSWRKVAGDYKCSVGSSSRDTRLSFPLVVDPKSEVFDWSEDAYAMLNMMGKAAPMIMQRTRLEVED